MTAPAPRAGLALASVRVTRGNPTAEEVAAVAALLAARLRPVCEEAPSEVAPPSPLARGARRPRPFAAPGAWAS